MDAIAELTALSNAASRKHCKQSSTTNEQMKHRTCAMQLATIIPQFQNEPPHASYNTSHRSKKLSSNMISATSKLVTAKTCGKCTHQ